MSLPVVISSQTLPGGWLAAGAHSKSFPKNGIASTSLLGGTPTFS
jgi:hypothetical protein